MHALISHNRFKLMYVLRINVLIKENQNIPANLVSKSTIDRWLRPFGPTQVVCGRQARVQPRSYQRMRSSTSGWIGTWARVAARDGIPSTYSERFHLLTAEQESVSSQFLGRLALGDRSIWVRCKWSKRTRRKQTSDIIVYNYDLFGIYCIYIEIFWKNTLL